MIWRPKQLTRSQCEERRLQAGRLLQAGALTQAAIARHMGVSRMAVSKWAKHLREHHGVLASLRNRPMPGRPSRLTAAQWQRLLRWLKQGALRAGFETDRWTLRRIRAVIIMEFGVDYHAHYLARRLKALGWSPQRPAVYARERDDALVKAWLQRDWPRIKKARCTKATIVFVDETGFSFRARTATTWAPIGRTPILRRVSKRREFSTVVGLTLSGHIYKRHFARAIHGDDVVVALRHFQRHAPGPLIVIWDRLNAHRATVVKEYISAHPEVAVEWLPPYAPDLNPEEGCHGNVKQRLRNATPGTISELRAQVDRGFARLRRRPDLLLSFFRHAGLGVNQLW